MQCTFGGSGSRLYGLLSGTAALEEAWQAAQLTAGELDVGSAYPTEVEYKEQNGYRYMEVRVYAPNRERQLCSLLKCAP